jgi:hypothetical protein
MELVRASICMHGCATLRRIGVMVGIRPVDTARLLADCSGGVAWLTWAAAMLECYSHEDVAWFQQEAGRIISLKSAVVPHLRELVAALKVTAPRLGTVSFPEHYAKVCGSMRQALFEKLELSPPQVAEPPAISDVHELLIKVATAFTEQTPVVIRGQQSIGWLAATLSWIYGDAVEILAAGKVVVSADLRADQPGKPALMSVELCDDDSSLLVLEYVLNKETIISNLTSVPRTDSLTSFGPKRSRADEYFSNWLNCTTPLDSEFDSLAAAAAQFTCGLLRTIHVTNEGNNAGFQAESQESGKQLVNILKLPGAYSDVRRVLDFFKANTNAASTPSLSTPSASYTSATSQLQIILRAGQNENEVESISEGGSITALAFLSKVPSLREVYARMVREMLRIGIKGENDCYCVVPGSGPEAFLPSAHEPHCGIYQGASLGVELVAACICSLFIEGPTSPRLTMFHASPLRWAISKAIEQSVLTGSALISGADLMKSVLVLAALDGMIFSPVSVGRVLAFPAAIIHRGQYYERLVVGPCRSLGGGVMRSVQGELNLKRKQPHDETMIQPSTEGAAEKIEILIRETSTDLELIVRSRQTGGLVKEHDMWHCITAALTANVLGDCKHKDRRGYRPRAGEAVDIVGTGTDLGRGVLHADLTMAMVGKPLDRLLACGANVNMVVRTGGCLNCAVSAARQVGYRYIVS